MTHDSHADMIEIEPSHMGEQLRVEARWDANMLRSDPAYAAEMRAVREDMEAIRAW